MASKAVPTEFYAIVVVEHEGRFLVIRERKHDRAWYLPAGRVENGETMMQAAVRETMEEAGVAVEPTGLLRFEQQWLLDGPQPRLKMRFVFRARTTGSLAPKAIADEHSLEARWLLPDEIRALPLRDPEVVTLIESRCPALPLDSCVVWPPRL